MTDSTRQEVDAFLTPRRGGRRSQVRQDASFNPRPTPTRPQRTIRKPLGVITACEPKRTPSKRSATTASLNTDIEFNEAQADRKKRLDAELQAAKTSVVLEEERLEREKDRNEQENRLERERLKTGHLQKQRQFLIEEKTVSAEKHLRNEHQLLQQLQQAEERVSELEAASRCMRDTTERANTNRESTIRKLTLELKRSEERASLQEKRADSLSLETEALKKRMTGASVHGSVEDELRRALRDAELVIEGKDKALQCAKDGAELAHQLTDELKSISVQEQALEDCQHLIETLKERLTNQHLLEEELNYARSQLDASRTSNSKTTRIEVENESLRNTVARWEEILGCGLGNIQSVSHVERQLSSLQRENRLMLAETSELKSKVIQGERAVKDASVDTDAWHAKLHALQEEIEALKDKHTRQERWMRLVKKDRDALRSLLDSYNESEPINDDGTRQASRIAHLESAVRDRSKELEQLNSLLDKSDIVREPCLLAENDRLKSKVETLEDQVAVFEYRMGCGDYNPLTTKVLHRISNPLSDALRDSNTTEAELTKLRVENESLRSELEGKTGSSASTSSSSIADLEARNAALVKQVEEIRIGSQRLKQVFKKMTDELRATTFRLLGFKIDAIEQHRFRLRSMYAANAQDSLIFQTVKTDGVEQLQLLANDFSLGLQPELASVLSNHDSIPVFLAHMTIFLFTRGRNIGLPYGPS
eukprot:TRINITY_DN6032_c0_g1_i1.p1 TRINITY_DN6032_c0_g1~~TRINITY_DN6032_c0_g1_i1.p1  ORF type:complete len:710 (-),score=141.28 TRINITY_DN6032_c0_g1_i1:31-2160(-)